MTTPASGVCALTSVDPPSIDEAPVATEIVDIRDDDETLFTPLDLASMASFRGAVLDYIRIGEAENPRSYVFTLPDVALADAKAAKPTLAIEYVPSASPSSSVASPAGAAGFSVGLTSREFDDLAELFSGGPGAHTPTPAKVDSRMAPALVEAPIDRVAAAFAWQSVTATDPSPVGRGGSTLESWSDSLELLRQHMAGDFEDGTSGAPRRGGASDHDRWSAIWSASSH